MEIKAIYKRTMVNPERGPPYEVEHVDPCTIIAFVAAGIDSTSSAVAVAMRQDGSLFAAEVRAFKVESLA